MSIKGFDVLFALKYLLVFSLSLLSIKFFYLLSHPIYLIGSLFSYSLGKYLSFFAYYYLIFRICKLFWKNFTKQIKKTPFLLIIFFLIFSYSTYSMIWNDINSYPKNLGLCCKPRKGEYSTEYWYFLNRTPPIFPISSNGSAYLEEGKDFSIPKNFKLIKPKNKNGWNPIISNSYYYWITAYSLIIGLTISIISGGILETNYSHILKRNFKKFKKEINKLIHSIKLFSKN